MSYWVETGTCGNCKYFEYKGKYEKGYCSWYGTHYHNDETCSHQEDKED